MSGKIAVVGAGLIGQAWAIAFARANHPVSLHDHDPAAARAAKDAIAEKCRALAARDLLGGQSSDDLCARISHAETLHETVADAIHIQENTPEDATIKAGVFAQLDALSSPGAVIASSSSALLPSQFTRGLDGADRCLIAHPLNPPHLIPAVEIVPGPATSRETVSRTVELMRDIGQSPVTTTREVEGFIMNRLQGALLDEAFSLVDKGLASVEDIDTAVRDGLARRWVFMGPFQTIDLNAPGGVSDFIDRYGPAYDHIGAERPNRARWEGRLRETVTAACAGRDRAALSNQRDDRLAALAQFLTTRKD